MRSNSRRRRGYVPARIRPALFIAFMFAAALVLSGGVALDRLLPRAAAQVTPTLGTPYTQNFDTLPASGSATWTNNSTIPGWFHARTGTGTTIVANNGSSNAGNLYSYGTGTATDRALGSLGSGNAAIGNLFWGVRLQNNTGSTITQLDISYTGEQWRNSAAAAQTLSFSYLVGAPTVTGSLAEFQSAGVAVPQLDFTSPITGGVAAALDGNLAANRVTLTHSITGLSIPNGTEIMLRWSDPDHTGADHGLSIDDFSVTAQGAVAPTPTLNISDVTMEEGNAGTTNFTFNVTLTSAAPAGGVTFDIATADGTAQDDNPGTEDDDYVAQSLTGQSIPATQTGPYQFTVQVNGDPDIEPNETFFVNVTNITGANAGDTQGQGTITNDDFNLTLISQIQGSTPSGNADSPRAGETHSVRGIVTLLKSNGFFVQEETGDNDSDPNTSEGIFVFTSSAPTTAVGNQVTVTGTVVEFNGLTEISTSNANVITNSTGNTLPTAVTLTATDLPPTAHFTQPQLEKYEAMRLTVPSLTTATHNDSFFDVPAVITGQPRPLREPGVPADNTIPPDPTSGTPDCCVPVFDLNPQQIVVDTNGRAGSTGETLTSNVVITGLAGPLDFAFGAYRIINDAALVRTPNMSAVPVPTAFSTEFTVAGFNIENFNNGATQKAKAALGIVRVMRMPDIIGHAEIFDLASLQALATAVNAQAVLDGHPDPMYEARLIPTPVAGITQNVGFLVKTTRVQINSVTQERASSTYIRPSDGMPDETHDRPPLVLRATVDPAGVARSVIVIVNHTRSFIDIELVAGDGLNVRAKRKAQAEDLADLFNDLQTDNPGVPVIAVGDYNAFQFSSGYDDPISVMKGSPTADDQIVVDASPDLVNPNFFNLIDELPASEQYTFTFDEQSTASITDYEELTSQALDHVLVNTAAHDINTRIAVARMNADFPEAPAAAFANDATRPERNSDHDAPVAYFTLFAEAQAGQLLISEFRHFGPASAEDEFIEIYNNTEAEHVVAAGDGSPGYSVSTITDQIAGTPRCIIPNGTRIPARGYFLCVNSDGYSLGSYPSGTSRSATADATYTSDIPVNAGLALFTTADTTKYDMATRLDAVGPASESNAPLYKEGAGYPDIMSTAREYSFYRDLGPGTPKDTNDNATDFVYVNTEATNEGAGGRLGAPGPQNLSSPTQRNQIIKASLIDPMCAGLGTASASIILGSSPDGTPVMGCQNTARDFTSLTLTQPTTSVNGTFYIRRRFRNTTTQNVTRLRLRVVNITTTPEMGVADLRLVTSGAVAYTTTGGEAVTVQGLTLEEPPTQVRGGGFNSSAQCCTAAMGFPGARTISLAEPLAPNATIDLQFRFGVMATGAYRFFINVEAELQPAPVMMVNPSKAGASNSKQR